MSLRTPSPAVCEKFQREMLDGVGGATMDPTFRETHLGQCEECRLEWEALAAIRHREDEPAIEPMDDLAAQRLINDLVSRVEEAPEEGLDDSPPEELSPTTRRPRRRRSGWAWVMAAAAVAVALVFVVGRMRRVPVVNERSPRIPPVRTVQAEVLLRSGDVTLPRAGPLVPGDRIIVGAGRAAVRVGTAVKLWLGEGSEVEIGTRTAQGDEVTLHRGELLAVVTPGTPDSGFRVRTREGTVVVTGTVFSVRRDSRGTVTEVLRGCVRAEATGRTPVRVRADRWARVGAGGAGDISGERQRGLWRRADVLGLLAPVHAARLDLRSQPDRVQVRVDGIELGQTPLVVALRPGHRRLELQRTGWTTIREHVLLQPGARLRRDYDLERAPAPGVAHRAPPAATPPTSPRAPSVGHHGAAVAADKGWQAILKRAQMRRAAQDWRGAARAYRSLTQRYPRRPEASTALVSLGYLQLEHLGQASQALRSFERYLRRRGRGPLAQEAAWGRIRCLRRLGRAAAEIRSLRKFLKRYHNVVSASRARARLRELLSRPDSRP